MSGSRSTEPLVQILPTPPELYFQKTILQISVERRARPFYTTADPIRGLIVLHSPTAEAVDRIELDFIGRARSTTLEWCGQGNCEHDCHPVLYRHTQTLAKFPDRELLQPGRYIYPFKFIFPAATQVPRDEAEMLEMDILPEEFRSSQPLPPSMRASQSEAGYAGCSVGYTLIARLIRPRDTWHTVENDATAERTLSYIPKLQHGSDRPVMMFSRRITLRSEGTGLFARWRETKEAFDLCVECASAVHLDEPLRLRVRLAL